MIFKNLKEEINQRMSLSNQMQNYIDNIMDNYMNSISEKYSIDRLELQQLWSGELSRPVKKSSSSRAVTSRAAPGEPSLSVNTDDLSLERLLKCTKNELAGLCKSRGLKCGGKKDDLIARLQELDSTPAPTVSKAVSKTAVSKGVSKGESKTASKSESKTASKTSESRPQPVDILKTISNNITPIRVRTNDFGNLEHPPTRLIFNQKEKRVIGRQEDDGTVSELCDEDIETCKKYKFQYDIPPNLDKKSGLEKVKVAEMGEDDEIDVEDELVEEEVEEETEELADSGEVEEEEIEEEEVEEEM
jgi:hypothetical protein